MTGVVTLKYITFKIMVGIFDGDNAVATIPTGAVIETPMPLPEIGLVQIRYAGRLIWVVSKDIHECGRETG